MTNELKLLNNIVASETSNLSNVQSLEVFVKDAYSNSFACHSLREKEEEWRRYLSHTGERNHPPDYMVRGGSAGEIKKLEQLSINTQVQFNSSKPAKELCSSNPKITERCRNCEEWTVKPLVYVFGNVKNGRLVGLCVVSGELLFSSIVEDVVNVIENGIESIVREDNVRVATTRELGKLENIGYHESIALRVRGMFLVRHPLHTFGNVINIERFDLDTCKLVAILNQDLYNSIPHENKVEAESLGLQIGNRNIYNNNGEDTQVTVIRKDITL